MKQNKIQSFIREEKLDFVAIQESKMEHMERSLCDKLWGSENCGWVFFPTNGNSGGMLSLWDASLGKLIFYFSGNRFLGVCLEWGSKKQRCFVVNIYTPCNLAGKWLLWENLKMSKMGYGKGLWCVVGDYNAITRMCEKRGLGSQIPRQEMEDFRLFTADMELVDVPLLGRKYTWYRSDGSAMSRLDWFLLSEEWIANWGVVAQWALSRELSDHCPITLKMGNQEWGPKPFRFNNCWLSHPGFKKLVAENWSSWEYDGWKACVLNKKLKSIHSVIRNWNQQVFGCLDENIKVLKDKIGDLDLKAEEVGLKEDELETRRGFLAQLWQQLKDRESLLRQKSRQK